MTSRRVLPDPCFGSWLSIGNPAITEIAVDAGFDWLLIDLEHGGFTEAAVPELLRVFRGSSTLPIVRVGGLYPDQIARLLDWGAAGIMAPHVNTAEEAAAYVRAMRYPPDGERGVSRSVRAYQYGVGPFTGNDPAARPLFIAQIETLSAVQRSASIAATDGVDVLFVGPADLQFDLKARPEAATLSYQACLQQVTVAAREAEKKSGILVRDIADLKSILEDGFSLVGVDSDLSLLRSGYQRLMTHIHPQQCD